MSFKVLNSQRLVISFVALSMTLITSPVYSAGTTSIDTRVERLERRISRLTDLMLQVDALKRENSELRGQIELQNNAFEALKRRQRDLYIDVDQRLSDLKKKQAVNAPSTAVTQSTTNDQKIVKKANAITNDAKATKTTKVTSTQSSNEEDGEYKSAFKLLSPSERRYPEAITALMSFLKKYPDSQLADNAQYWLAEANYVSQKNDVALVEFQKVISQYPDSPKVSGALLKIGYLQHSAGNIDLAKKALNDVIKTYGGSAAANMATKRLERINKENN